MPTGLPRWALVALDVALVAGLLGFGGIAGAAVGIARTLFWSFLMIFVVVPVLHLLGRGKGPVV